MISHISVHFPYEFHISRKARDYYQFDDTLYAFNGNVIFANFHSVRLFAKKINDKRDLSHYPEQAIQSGQLNAMGLIDEILHYVLGQYKKDKQKKIIRLALDYLYKNLGKKGVNKILYQFADEFPPIAVYKGKTPLDEYIKAKSKHIPNIEIILEEFILLWLAKINPAFYPFIELFDDTHLERSNIYYQMIETLHHFFNGQPLYGPENQNLIDMLHSPAVAVPYSLKGQLEYIRKKWGYLLHNYICRLLLGLDLISEEEKMALFGPGPTTPLDFTSTDSEPECFSTDLDWMPRVVMIAKNIHVWLDQLSRIYQKSITTLDQIPDEELDLLGNRGFTALWLIGLWERSKASKKIKNMCGNPEAEASAYSLFEYEIAHDLGGFSSFQNLKKRAWQRGIRMAGDMVPNHMGIDSKWVVDHPDWFLSLSNSPYPSYTFHGPNVSWDENIGIYLEDHYYNRTDAAVVFKRIDHQTGDERFIYHGNDGTSMPWNDTAQLNFLNPKAREAVIQVILHVASLFPIIRFDAAMTLVKRHIQRLWFPEPGTGGAVASRTGQGLTMNQLDHHLPNEFWREVVDRIKEEVPDTLLLAEAFWMLEGYFVRTLGMHRVYNSAFMNMLKNEENAKYRALMKNTLSFNPEILKRFVNFMNNPDEETAIAQFGRNDKYFGVCIMMSTMPGLPMFGHGQIEGYTEKYGMEYHKAYWDEQPDPQLIERHEREIFPLLHKRYLFAHVDNFLFYDFITPHGTVDDNVFAFSNQFQDERVLIVYHNTFSQTQGWIRHSVFYASKSENNHEKSLIRKQLGEGLSLKNDPNIFYTFRDPISGLEYIRNSQLLCQEGLYVALEAFKYHIFMDFREVSDDESLHYAHLHATLKGRGVPSIDQAHRELILIPLHEAFSTLVNKEMLLSLINELEKLRYTKESAPDSDFTLKLDHLFKRIQNWIGLQGNRHNLTDEVLKKWYAMKKISKPQTFKKLQNDQKDVLIFKYIKSAMAAYDMKPVLLQWLIMHILGKIIQEDHFEQISRSWIDEWLVNRIMADGFISLGYDEQTAWKNVDRIKLMTSHQRWFVIPFPENILESLLRDGDVQKYIGLNRYQGTLWFHEESFDLLLQSLFIIGVVDVFMESERLNKMSLNKIRQHYQTINKLHNAAKQSEYKLEKLQALIREESTPVSNVKLKRL